MQVLRQTLVSAIAPLSVIKILWPLMKTIRSVILFTLLVCAMI